MQVWGEQKKGKALLLLGGVCAVLAIALAFQRGWGLWAYLGFVVGMQAGGLLMGRGARLVVDARKNAVSAQGGVV